MDFTKIGFITGYAKTMKKKYDWNKKKKDNDLGPQSKKTELQRKNDIFKADYAKMQASKDNDKALDSIRSKVQAGADLTYSEMQYLREKDPALYQKLKSREIELKNYERELKRCKTKEEVERLRMTKLSEALTRIKANEGSAQEELKKLQEFKKIDAKFAKDGDFSKLPTENEVTQAQKQENEQKQAETEKLFDEVREYARAEAENNEPLKFDFVSSEQTFENEKPSIVRKENIPASNEVKTEEKVKRARARAAYAEAENNFKAASPNIFAGGKSVKGKAIE